MGEVGSISKQSQREVCTNGIIPKQEGESFPEPGTETETLLQAGKEAVPAAQTKSPESRWMPALQLCFSAAAYLPSDTSPCMHLLWHPATTRKRPSNQWQQEGEEVLVPLA